VQSRNGAGELGGLVIGMENPYFVSQTVSEPTRGKVGFAFAEKRVAQLVTGLGSWCTQDLAHVIRVERPERVDQRLDEPTQGEVGLAFAGQSIAHL
jgi:hypothetical protein